MRFYEMLKYAGIAPDSIKIADFSVDCLLPLDLANESSISYVEFERYLPLARDSKAGAILAANKFKEHLNNKNVVFVENPHLVFAYFSHFFKKIQIQNNASFSNSKARIYDGAFVGENVRFGKNCVIMPNAVICDSVSFGDNCVVYPSVVIYSDCVIGNNVKIHAGSVIGSDGFGYAHTKMGEHIKIEHFGNVIIEDDVEIGANVAIDRAVFESTIIKKGAKIDNLVQIGHNCVVGEHSLLVSQVGLAGSTTMGRNVVMGGQAGTGGHIHIGDFVQIAGRGAVGKNLPPNTKWGGHPLMDLKQWQKMHVKLRKMTQEKGNE